MLSDITDAHPDTRPTPFKVTGNPKTGVSPGFLISTSSVNVEWTVNAPKGGCAFSLILSTKANGPIVKNDIGLITSGGEQTGLTDWDGIPPAATSFRRIGPASRTARAPGPRRSHRSNSARRASKSPA